MDHTVGMSERQRSLSSSKVLRASAVAERAEGTREALLEAARRLFVEKGYFSTSTEEIVASAGVGTRGALYHHFADKRALFVAVIERAEEELLASSVSGVAPAGALERLRGGLMGLLEASLTPAVQRILLIDGPAVLGWQEWRALEERYGLGALHALLELAVAEGVLADQPLDALAHILLAVVDEAALFIANAADPKSAKVEAVAAVDQLLSGLIPAIRGGAIDT